MGDVEVATDDLRALSDTLAQLSKDLTSSDANVEYERTQLAHRKVIDAMDEFHSNWNDNRDYVASKLDTLADMADQTADGFDETDADLAKQISEVMDQ
jgi:uncharacterized protein YukE